MSKNSRYAQEYKVSVDNPEAFWAVKAKQLPWYRLPENTLSVDSNGIQRWFADGEMNTCYMAVDHHVATGRGDQPAIIYDSPVAAQSETITYRELLTRVSTFAGVLANHGVVKGDRVIIYMPMIPDALVAMLAVARLGAIHSVVFGGFAAPELAVRIDDAKPKVVVSASCGIEISRVIEYKPLLDNALELATHKTNTLIVKQRPQALANMQNARDVDWDKAMANAQPVECVPVKGIDPLYILYTSGTTGKPKGVVRDNGGHAVALHYSMSTIYDTNPGDVYWAASDVGWVVGHSYIVYGPLLAGCTTIVYEGKPIKTPDAGAFWRVCEEHKVKVLFAAPTAFRAIKKEDPEGRLIGQYDLSNLQSIFMAGERLDPPTFDWTVEKAGKPVFDHWWQTETGWAICGNPTGLGSLPVKAGSSTVPTPGFNVVVLDDNGQSVGPGVQGAIAIKLPLPPSCLPTIWGDHQRFESGYLNEFPGYYSSGDGGYIDGDGYVFIMGRTDDVINVAGHRLSTGEMEEVVAAHPAIAECCVIGVQDSLKGQLPIALVILKDGAGVDTDADEEAFQQQLIDAVNQQIGRIACFQKALVVNRLPKTRSGKILRKIVRQIADQQEYAIPSTIDDPTSIDELVAAMQDRRLI